MRNLTWNVKHLLGALAVVLLALAASVALADTSAPSPAALEGIDAYAAIELANAWKGSEVTSYATTEAVFFTFPDGTEAVVPMPRDEVFVSVAPYLDRTHPCTTHYMSGCQGELVDVAVRVRAVRPDGSLAMDEIVDTGANGFLDLWLPRGEAFLLDLSIDGYAVQGIVATGEGSPTCITTMRLTPGGS